MAPIWHRKLAQTLWSKLDVEKHFVLQLAHLVSSQHTCRRVKACDHSPLLFDVPVSLPHHQLNIVWLTYAEVLPKPCKQTLMWHSLILSVRRTPFCTLWQRLWLSFSQQLAFNVFLFCVISNGFLGLAIIASNHRFYQINTDQNLSSGNYKAALIFFFLSQC